MAFKINVKHLYTLLKQRKNTNKTSKLPAIHIQLINPMKHSASDSAFHTNLLQALQKNKVMQGKLTEYEHSHYIKLLKDMQTYSLKEKYNRELLYTWKKESYIRQLRKSLQEYEQQRHECKR